MLGTVCGSFLSVFTYRLVKGKNFVKGRSYCPKCKKKISWYDNIPLLSYVLLKGKCRNCKKKISIRYPLLELSTGFLFLGTFLKALNCINTYCVNCSKELVCLWTGVDFMLGYILLIVLLLVLVSIFLIDVEEMIIPDSIIFSGFLIFYIFYALFFSEDLFTFLLSGLVSGLFLLSLHLITLGRGMGLGDVKFAILGGFVLGSKLTVVWLFLSFVVGAVVGLLLIGAKKAKFGRHVPFGPFLAISFIITIFFGSELYGILNIPF